MWVDDDKHVMFNQYIDLHQPGLAKIHRSMVLMWTHLLIPKHHANTPFECVTIDWSIMNIERTDDIIQVIDDTRAERLCVGYDVVVHRGCGLDPQGSNVVDNDDVICHCHTRPPEFQTDSTIHSQNIEQWTNISCTYRLINGELGWEGWNSYRVFEWPHFWRFKLC